MVRFKRFALDDGQIAPVIYGKAPHFVTADGVVIGPSTVTALREFLKRYNQFVNAPQHPYYRIDAYFSEQELHILEINAAFVDGWGTALNLARASNVEVRKELLGFPKSFVSLESVYVPELRLFVSELERLGIGENTVRERISELGADESAYIYGRFGGREQIDYPMQGIRLDNKLNLARFSQQWYQDGVPGVQVPRHFSGCDGLLAEAISWEELLKPRDEIGSPGTPPLVFKFCDKGGPECQKYRKSVIIGVPEGKNKYLHQCYEFGTVIAQDYVRPAKFKSDNCQLVILAVGDEPITGYVQYSSKDIINDNSVHGPLALIG